MKWLKSQRVWGVWRNEVNSDGKLTKVPHVAATDAHVHAKVDRAADWCDFDTAQKRVTRGGFDGVCYLIADSVFAAIDIDGASHTGGEGRNPLEAEVLQLFAGTYAERSPSGDGIHILFRVKPEFIPHSVAEGGKAVWNGERYKMKDKATGLEIYMGAFTRRFFTFTGDQISEGDEIVDCTDAACEFLERFMRKPQSVSSAPAPSAPAGEPLTHEQILERLEIARRAKDGEKFMRLYDEGNTADYGGDDSAADAGLCVLLTFWMNREPAAMDEAFRSSKLYRSKWDERHGRDTYGAITIEAAIKFAISKNMGVYSPTAAGQFTFKYRPRIADDFSEAGNADVFAELYGGVLRHCPALGWLCWDGRVWRQDDGGAYAMVQEFSRLQFEESRQYVLTTIQASTDGKPSPDAEAYRRFALRMRSARALGATLSLAQSKLPIRADELDANEYELNTPAGIVCLLTGEISPHRANAYCTKMTAYAPSTRGAQSWRAFLDLVSGGNVEWQAYVQTVAGMAAVGKITDERLIVAHGGGANGKTTLFNALQTVLGDYAGTCDSDILTLEYRGNIGAQMATLRGKRLVTCSELEQGQRLSTKMLKRLAAADALMQIEQKYKMPEQIKPTQHIILHTNVLPRILSDDEGTWRRLCAIPFTQRMPTGEKKIANYDEVLVQSAGEAILAWILEGAREFCEDGFKLPDPPPACIAAATAEYRHGQRTFQNFVDERCEVGDKLANVTAEALYAAYVDWAVSNGDSTPMSKSDVNAELEMMRLRKTMPQRRPVWHGIRLKSEQE